MINALLVDDEEKSIMNLELLLSESCPDVNIIGRAANALVAVKAIIDLKPDVVFLDVHMPGYSGFDVLDSVKDSPAILVFTTAHRNYAINALRKGAFDYLLKPIDTEELRDCVQRVREKLSRTDGVRPIAAASAGSSGGLIELSVKDGIIFIRPNELIRLEASGSYTVFHLENDVKHVGSRSMKEYEGLLDGNQFFRCHNSHIINLRKVTRFITTNGFFVELSNGSIIELSKRNKDIFLEKLKSLDS